MPVGLAGLAMINPSSGAGLGEQFRGWLIMAVLADLEQYRLDAERGEDVAIGGIAGHRERHPVSGLERGEKRQLKGGRRAGRDDDFGRVDRQAVLRAIVPGDRLAQRRYAERVGVADAGIIERLARRLQHRLRRRRAGLADFEMDDISPRQPRTRWRRASHPSR